MKLSGYAAVLLGANFFLVCLWGVATAKKRAGPLLPQFLSSRKEIGDLLVKGATSSWDPFTRSGHKRWRAIFAIEFGVFVLLSFLNH
jgi:hypothetical protein